MSAYTQVLEFFMENGIQLTTDQMEDLKMVCEKSNFDKYIDSKINKAEELNKKARMYDDIAKTSSKEAKYKAADLSRKYRDNAEKTGKITKDDGNYRSFYDVTKVSDIGENSKNGRGYTSSNEEYRRNAREGYKQKAAEKRRGGVDTENRKPGTFLSK